MPTSLLPILPVSVTGMPEKPWRSLASKTSPTLCVGLITTGSVMKPCSNFCRGGRGGGRGGVTRDPTPQSPTLPPRSPRGVCVHMCTGLGTAPRSLGGDTSPLTQPGAPHGVHTSSGVPGARGSIPSPAGTRTPSRRGKPPSTATRMPWEPPGRPKGAAPGVSTRLRSPLRVVTYMGLGSPSEPYAKAWHRRLPETAPWGHHGADTGVGWGRKGPGSCEVMGEEGQSRPAPPHV